MRGLVACWAALVVVAWSQMARAECPAIEQLIGQLKDQSSPKSALEFAFAAAQSWDTPPDWVPSGEKAAWPASRDRALAILKQFGDCDLETVVRPEAAMFQRHFQKSGTTIKETLRLYATRAAGDAASHGQTVPFFSPILGPGQTVPAPQPIQVGLSQTVSGGQPGMSASIAGSPGAQGDNALFRHFMITGSALIVQTPATTTASSTKLGEPQFVSGELAFSYTSRRTLYDWSSEIGNHLDELISDLDRHAWNATKRLLKEYAEGVAIGQSPKEALVAADREGKKTYEDASEAYYEQQIVAPEYAKDHDSHFDLSLRGRMSPRPDFMPELPDLVEFGAEASGELALGAPDRLHMNLAFRALVAGSIFPTTTFRRIDWGVDDPKTAILTDATLSGALVMPSSSTSINRTRLVFSGLLRYAPRKDASDNREVSAGGNVGIEVPLGDTVALAGTYTVRWINGVGVEALSALTIAKAFTGQ